MRMWTAGLWVGLTVLSAGVALAVEPFAETPQETAMCSAYMYGGRDKAFKVKTEGEDWIHMHHYCDCVRYRYRALRKISDKYAFKYDLGVAIGGCDYVLDKTSKGFYMRPKVLVDKGRAQRMLGSTGPAARSFLEAIQMNRSEVSAYLELAETQKGMGQGSQALETLLQGVRNNPDAMALQQRYREMGGKEAFPEPAAKAVPQPPPAPAESSQAPQNETPAAEARQEKPREPDEAKPQEPSLTGCRFCPPETVKRKWEDSFKGKSE